MFELVAPSSTADLGLCRRRRNRSCARVPCHLFENRLQRREFLPVGGPIALLLRILSSLERGERLGREISIYVRCLRHGG